MTTIAWDGETMAADRQINVGTYSDASHTKIVRNKKGDLCGAAGCTPMCEAFRNWFVKGEKGKRPPLKVDNEGVNAIIVRKKDGSITVFDENGPFSIDKCKYATGSGWQFAVAAMDMGAYADRAVHVASKYDKFTGREIDVFHLNPPKATVEKTNKGVAIIYGGENGQRASNS